MIRLRILLILLLTVFPVSLQAVLVTTIPANPTDQDYVVLRIEGARPNTCWEYTGLEYLGVENYQISINVYWVDHWMPWLGCGDMAVEFLDHCVPGQLAPGQHTVIVHEYSASQRDPTTYVQTFEFYVDSVVAIQSVSWGRIKLIHR